MKRRFLLGMIIGLVVITILVNQSFSIVSERKKSIDNTFITLEKISKVPFYITGGGINPDKISNGENVNIQFYVKMSKDSSSNCIKGTEYTGFIQPVGIYKDGSSYKIAFLGKRYYYSYPYKKGDFAKISVNNLNIDVPQSFCGKYIGVSAYHQVCVKTESGSETFVPDDDTELGLERLYANRGGQVFIECENNKGCEPAVVSDRHCSSQLKGAVVVNQRGKDCSVTEKIVQWCPKECSNGMCASINSGKECIGKHAYKDYDNQKIIVCDDDEYCNYENPGCEKREIVEECSENVNIVCPDGSIVTIQECNNGQLYPTGKSSSDCRNLENKENESWTIQPHNKSLFQKYGWYIFVGLMIIVFALVINPGGEKK